MLTNIIVLNKNKCLDCEYCEYCMIAIVKNSIFSFLLITYSIINILSSLVIAEHLVLNNSSNVSFYANFAKKEACLERQSILFYHHSSICEILKRDILYLLQTVKLLKKK